MAFPDLTDPQQMQQFAGLMARFSNWNNPPSGSTYPTSSTAGYPGTSSTYSPGYPSPSSSGTGAPTDPSALLRLYGVQQPEIRESPLFSNSFMQAHPALGSVLNNALVGMALTPDARGPEGAGAGISRALRGSLAVQPYMRQFQMEQAEAPIQYADALAKLYGTTAQAQMYAAHATNFNEAYPERYAAAQLRLQGQLAKAGQPIHDSTGKLLGFYGSEGFRSAESLGIPDEANVGKQFNSTPRYNLESYTQSVIADQMKARFGSDQSKWPSVPQDIWQAGISEAQKQFKVLPQEAINSNRQGPSDEHWRATTQLSIQRLLETEQARINSRYDRITNDPMIKWNDKNRLDAEAQRKQELQDAQDSAKQLQDTLLGSPQNSQQPAQSKRNPKANAVPARPANVPSDYVFNPNGPKGRGWYAPDSQ